MRNKDSWYPSKYKKSIKGFKASNNPKEVGIGSRVIADISARQYSKLLQNHAKGFLLDLGCGKCPLYEMYKDSITDSVCVDWTKGLHGITFLDVIANINQPLPFREKSFDTIVMTDVLEHLYQPLQAWAEISRILKPGGKVIIGVPFLYWIHEAPYDYYRYTEFALKRMAEENGLNTIVLTPIGGIIPVLLDLLLKSLVHFSNSLAVAASVVARHAIKYNMATSIGGRIFPIGYVLVAQKNKLY
jgi:SAM-dependent methyltransferase